MKPPAFAPTLKYQRERSYGSLAKIASVGPVQLHCGLRSWHGGGLGRTRLLIAARLRLG
jgi:hypothetical protein